MTENVAGRIERKGYLRLSLRGLLLLILILSVWLARTAHRARVQREAVTAIRRAGGSVVYEHAMSPSSGRHRTALPPDWLVRRLGIDCFEDVLLVNLDQRTTSPELLAHVGRLGRLRLLFLTSSSVTDAELEPLKNLKHLEYLDLSRTKVTDAGLVHLEGLHRLETLYLNENRSITDAGLAHLRPLSRLEFLSLIETGITDAGMEHLKLLSNLQQLSMDSTGVTNDGSNELQRALPKTSISHRPSRSR